MKSQISFGVFLVVVGFSMSACGGGSSASSSNSSSSSNSYEPQNLPGVYSVDLPQSLQSSGGGGTVRVKRMSARRHQRQFRSALSSSGTDYANQSQGYNELKNVVDQMMMQKSQISMRFLEADVIFGDVKSQCAGQSGECVIPAGTLSFTFTQEIVNYIVDSVGGEDGMDPMELEFYQSMIGAEMPLPEMRYTALNGQGGMDHSLEMIEAEGFSTKLTWNEARTQVVVYFEYSDPSWGSGNDSFSYNDVDKVMVYRNSSTSEGSSWTYTATVGEDSAKASLNGVKFSVGMKTEGSFGNFSMSILGVADDEGGYAESEYSSDHIPLTASGGGISSVLPTGNYVLVGASADCSQLDWMDVLGSAYYLDGSSLGSYYYGPSSAASALKLCSFEYDENYSMVNGQLIAGISFSAGSPVTETYYYSEIFNGAGELVKAGTKANASDPYSYYLTSSEGSEYETYYDSESSSGEFLADVKVAVSGVSGVSSDSMIVLMRDGEVFDGEDWSNVIGYGLDDGSGFSFTYWGTESEVSSADVYQVGYDSSGNSTVSLVSGASVQVQ